MAGNLINFNFLIKKKSITLMTCIVVASIYVWHSYFALSSPILHPVYVLRCFNAGSLCGVTKTLAVHYLCRKIVFFACLILYSSTGQIEFSIKYSWMNVKVSQVFFLI